MRIPLRVVAIMIAAACAAPIQASPQAPQTQDQTQTQRPQTDADRVTEIATASKFAVNRSDAGKQPIWTITRRAEHLKEFDVILMVKNGVLISFVTVAPKSSIRRTPDLMEKMLKMNYEYDSVKIGFDEDDDAYVRIDQRLRVVDAQEFNQIIEQVSSVADALYGAMKPYFTAKAGK
jgi:hypothetical protein